MHKTELLDLFMRPAVIAEVREWDNSMHLQRMRRYCLRIATELGVPVAQAEQIALASLLHDVGKSRLPDEIIKKAGKYSEQDWDAVRGHATAGAALLSNSAHPTVQLAETIARTHHERWDGSGYPDGLKGEQIPLPSRVCALADVYDALTTERAYKDLVPHDRAVEMIVESSGGLFDPDLVQIFKNVHQDLDHARRSFGS